MKKTKIKEKNNESQSVRLKKIEKSSVVTVIVGGVLLVSSLGMNTLLSAKEGEQLETTMYLNQYRLQMPYILMQQRESRAIIMHI